MSAVINVSMAVALPVYIYLVAEFAWALRARYRVGGPKHTRPWGLFYVVTITIVTVITLDAIINSTPTRVAMNAISAAASVKMAHFFRTWRDEDDDGNGLTSRVKRRIKSLITVRQLTSAPAAK